MLERRLLERRLLERRVLERRLLERRLLERRLLERRLLERRLPERRLLWDDSRSPRRGHGAKGFGGCRGEERRGKGAPRGRRGRQRPGRRSPAARFWIRGRAAAAAAAARRAARAARAVLAAAASLAAEARKVAYTPSTRTARGSTLEGPRATGRRKCASLSGATTTRQGLCHSMRRGFRRSGSRMSWWHI